MEITSGIPYLTNQKNSSRENSTLSNNFLVYLCIYPVLYHTIPDTISNTHFYDTLLSPQWLDENL